MDQVAFDNLRSRADAKLRYAAIHLQELQARGHYGGGSGDDFAQSHQESFLYHLLGAKEAFVRELNVYYRCELPQDGMSLGKLREKLRRQGKQSLEQQELYQLESDSSSWIYRAKEMRDHSTHVGGISRIYHYGGQNSGEVWLRAPKTGTDTGKHVIDELQLWHDNMENLLERLRQTAIQTSRSNNFFEPTL